MKLHRVIETTQIRINQFLTDIISHHVPATFFVHINTTFIRILKK